MTTSIACRAPAPPPSGSFGPLPNNTQVLESGQLTDSMGKRCSFRNSVLVLTTSPTTAALPAGWAVVAAEVGGEADASSSSSGGDGMTVVGVPEGHFHLDASDSGRPSGNWHSAHSAAALALEDEATRSTKRPGQLTAPVHPMRYVPAELLSRLDAAVSMQRLSAADMRRVLELQLADCSAALGQQGIQLTVEDAAAAWLATHGLSPVSGAQRLQPLLREQLLLPVAEALLEARLAAGAQPAPLALAITAGLALGGSGLHVRVG